MVAATKRLLQRRRRKTSSPDNDLLPTSRNRTHSTRAVIGSSSALQGSHSDTETLRSRIIEQSQEGGCYKRQNLFYGFHCRYLPRTQGDKIITCFYKTNMQSSSGTVVLPPLQRCITSKINSIVATAAAAVVVVVVSVVARAGAVIVFVVAS